MNRIARLLVGATLVSVISFPALAGEGPYLRFGGGVSLGRDGLAEKEAIVTPIIFTLDYLIEFDPGIVTTAAIGYEFFFPQSVADIRLELEGSYRHNEVDRIVGNIPTILVSDGTESEAIGGMLNGYLDFRTGLPIIPYIGAGVGMARVSYEVPGGIDDTDNAFAHQVMGGFYYRVIDTLSVGVEYRYFKTETLELGNTGFTPTYEQQAVMLNFSLGF